MPFILYIIILSSNFGFTLNWILNYFNKSLQLNQVKSVETPLVLPTFNLYAIFFAIAVLLYALFRLLIQPVLLIFNKISNTVIIATITLTNGTKLYNKYILRPSVDGNILIGDKPKITVDCEKIMLPKSSIFLIEFKRIYKSIEDKNSTTKEFFYHLIISSSTFALKKQLKPLST